MLLEVVFFLLLSIDIGLLTQSKEWPSFGKIHEIQTDLLSPFFFNPGLLKDLPAMRDHEQRPS